jgi:exopolysaccharide biosynthesis predicted pyruvyltransferase EpsI
MRRSLVNLGFAMLLTLAGCSETEPPNSALDTMLIVFQGKYTKRQIRSRLDEAFHLYGIPVTEENYLRYGSILVSLRRDSGSSATEMEILDQAIKGYTPEVKLEEMMAISNLMLQSGGW